MPQKSEHNSKGELASLYKVSRKTITVWLKVLQSGWREFMNTRQDPEYIAFETYKTEQKILTPLQIKVFKKHYGEP